MKVLAAAVDTLYLSAYVDLRDGLVARLEELRELSADRGADEDLVGMIGTAQYSYTRGGPQWRHRLDRPTWWTVMVDERARNDLAPTVQVQIRSELLWSVGAAESTRMVLEELLPHFGPVAQKRRRTVRGPAVTQPGVVVARVDLAADLEGWRLSERMLRRFVRRPRRFSVEYVPEEHRAAARRRLRKDDSDHRRGWGSGQLFTGFTFGRKGAPIEVVIYDKVEEIAQAGAEGKVWIAPWWGREEYDDGPRVWRVEARLRRAALKELGLSTPAEVLDGIPSLWRYVVGGPELDDQAAAFGWLSLRDIDRKARRSRWLVSSDWTVVQGARFRGDVQPGALNLVRARKLALDMATHRRRMVQGTVALAVGEGAPLDVLAGGVPAMLRWLLEHAVDLRYQAETGRRVADLVRHYRRRAAQVGIEIELGPLVADDYADAVATAEAAAAIAGVERRRAAVDEAAAWLAGAPSELDAAEVVD